MIEARNAAHSVDGHFRTERIHLGYDSMMLYQNQSAMNGIHQKLIQEYSVKKMKSLTWNKIANNFQRKIVFLFPLPPSCR